MYFASILLTTLSLLGSTGHQSLATDEQPVMLKVGDKLVKGSKLKPFENEWSRSGNSSAANIREVFRVAKVKGKKRYVRDQYFPMQRGMEMHTELVLDMKTLETISMFKEVLGLPEGASMGNNPTSTRWDFDGAKYSCTETIRGEPVQSEGNLQQPMFDGGGLGLVIAALPLKLGYEAKLPVAMALGTTADLTLYWVHLKVVALEPFPREKGKDLETFVVDVDWIDPATDEVTSKGGYDQPGGSYFILPKPPKGFPHVPVYANNGGTIDLEMP